MKILVSYRPKKGIDTQKIVISIPKNIEINSDRCNDLCDDKITEILGYHPRWIRVDAIVNS